MEPNTEDIALDDRLWHAYLSGLADGNQQGYQAGWTDAHNDRDTAEREAWALMRAAVLGAANSPTWTELCARRGEPVDIIARARATHGWAPLDRPPAGRGEPL